MAKPTPTYFLSLKLPNGEELLIATAFPVSTTVVDEFTGCIVLAAQIYPKRLDTDV